MTILVHVAFFTKTRQFIREIILQADTSGEQPTIRSVDSRNYRETESRINWYSRSSGIGALLGRDKAASFEGKSLRPTERNLTRYTGLQQLFLLNTPRFWH